MKREEKDCSIKYLMVSGNFKGFNQAHKDFSQHVLQMIRLTYVTCIWGLPPVSS